MCRLCFCAFTAPLERLIFYYFFFWLAAGLSATAQQSQQTVLPPTPYIHTEDQVTFCFLDPVDRLRNERSLRRQDAAD